MAQSSPLWAKGLQKANAWVNELATELGWSDPADTLQALRAVLHALRDRLPVNEAAQLAAQLPLLIKGVYYDGWNPAATPVRARTKIEFLRLVREPLVRSVPGADVEQVTRTVFRFVADHVSRGEIADVRGILPPELLELWPERAGV